MKFGRLALVLFATISVSCLAWAQPVGWARHLEVSETDYTLRRSGIAVAPDGTYYSAVSNNEFKRTNDTNNRQGTGTFISRSNATGAVLWSKPLSVAFSTMAVSSDGVFVGGNVFRGSSLTKFDPFGNLLWTRFDVGRDPHVASDSFGGVYIAYTQVSTNGSKSIVLAKYGPEGELQWRQNIPFGANPLLTEIRSDSQGNVYVVANAILKKYSSNGAFLWQSSSGVPAGGVEQFAISADDSVYILYQLEAYYISRVDKYSSGGTKIWSRQLPFQNRPNSIASSATGEAVVTFGTTNPQNNSPMTSVVRLSASGQAQWTKQFVIMPGPVCRFDSSGNLWLYATNGGSPQLADYAAALKVSPSGSLIQSISPMALYSQSTFSANVALNKEKAVSLRQSGSLGFGPVENPLTLIDGIGNAAWTTTSRRNRSDQVPQFLATDPMGNSFIASDARDPANDAPTYTAFKPMLSAYNASGNFLFSKAMAAPASAKISPDRVLPVSTGGCYVVSNSNGDVDHKYPAQRYDAAGNLLWSTSGTFEFGAVAQGDFLYGLSGPNLIKLNPSGTEAWRIPTPALGAPEKNRPIIQPSVDGGILYTNADEKDVVLMRVAANGSVLWTRRTSSIYGQLSYKNLFPTGDGGVYAHTSDDYNRIERYSSTGQLLGTYQPAAQTIHIDGPGVVDSAGNIFIVVNRWNYDPAQVQTIAKISSAGELLWAKPIFGANEMIVAKLFIDSQGRIVATGSRFSKLNSWNYAVARLTTDGILVDRYEYDSGWKLDDYQSVQRPEEQWRAGYSGCLIGRDSSGSIYMSGRSVGAEGTWDVNVVKFDVNAPVPNAQVVSVTAPNTMTCGQTYNVTVSMKNTGQATWTKANGYSLVCVLDETWSRSEVTLGAAESIAPGATKNFSFKVYAPGTPGAYDLAFTMARYGADFGQQSSRMVAVSKATDAARYVSRTGPLSVNTGEKFWVQHTMLNVGTSTWSTSTGYAMMSLNPANNTLWGRNRLYLSGGTYAPGAAGTFNGQCFAPMTPGTYTMQWQTSRNGNPFGDVGPMLTINVVQPLNNARFTSQSVPTIVGAGRPFPASITMVNTGSQTWSTAGGFSLRSVNSAWTPNSVPLPASVGNGQSTTFSATITAPSTPGTYTFQWRMSQNGGGFGEASAPVSIVVAADLAAYVSRTGPLTVKAGQQFWVQHIMRNDGASTWTHASGYTMMSTNPDNNLTWGRNRIYLPTSAAIAPGQSGTFTGLCTAPSAAGTYTMQWQCAKNSVGFPTKGPVLTIVVQSP